MKNYPFIIIYWNVYLDIDFICYNNFIEIMSVWNRTTIQNQQMYSFLLFFYWCMLIQNYLIKNELILDITIKNSLYYYIIVIISIMELRTVIAFTTSMDYYNQRYSIYRCTCFYSFLYMYFPLPFHLLSVTIDCVLWRYPYNPQRTIPLA